ncbi:MAG: hypothetical protein L3J83_02965 [Proteobacteria bacterium]|nr:hypothetical protein [Pseudomonadota bacterium]
MKINMKLNMKHIALIVLVLIPSMALSKASSSAHITETKKTEFVRINKSDDNIPVSLQMANVRYVPDDGIPNDMYVDLISVVHVADKSYYQYLNELFKTYDVVLYELVAPEGTRIDQREAGEAKGLLSMLQQGMKNVLGLSFQLEEVDYSPKNFVHADISPEDFKNSMDENGESFLAMFLRMWLVGIQQQATNPDAINNMDMIMAFLSPNKERDLKVIAAQQLLQMDPMMNAIEGNNGSTLVTTRNLKALKVLRQEMEKGHKTFAIFYGAAHMPEMETVLMKEFKMKQTQINWVDAWDLK